MNRLFGLLLLSACTDAGQGDDATTDVEGEGLPIGESAWSGTLSLITGPLDVDLSLTNSKGVLGGRLTFHEGTGDDAREGTFAISGVHEPASGRVVLVPGAWISDERVPRTVGFLGTWDPEAGTMVGEAIGTTSQADGTPIGGPTTFTLVASAGPLLAPGDGARAMDTGTNTFLGTFGCVGNPRPIRGTLENDGAGAVVGSFTWAHADLDLPVGTFEVEGVHDPTSGGLALVPGRWVERNGDGEYATFFVDVDYDPSHRSLEGDVRNDTGTCQPGLFDVVVDG